VILWISDGQILIMIWFKSWLKHHVWWFDLTTENGFDLNLSWFDLWFEEIMNLSNIDMVGIEQCSTTFADRHMLFFMLINKPKSVPKNSRRTELVGILCYFQIVFAKSGCHVLSSSITSRISEFQVWLKLWFD